MNKIKAGSEFNKMMKIITFILFFLFIFLLSIFNIDTLKKNKDTVYLLNLVMVMV